MDNQTPYKERAANRRWLARIFGLALCIIAVPSHAQIAFRGAASNTAAGVTPTFRAAASAVAIGTTLTIARPTGVVANDVLVASIGVTPSTVAITPPSGWALVRRTNNTSTTSNSLAVYYKIASAAEPASYAWTFGTLNFAVGGIQSFIGVDAANPIDVENGQTTPSGTAHATPNITTTVANAMVVTSHAFASSQAWTPPTGMTESFDRPNGAASATGLSIEGDRVLQPIAGATGVKTATAAGSADAGNTHILSLRPARVSLTIATPAGTVANDMMIAGIGFNNSSATINPPAGWALVRRMNNAGTTSNSLAVYRKAAAIGEPASHTWGIAGGAFLVGGIQSFSGVDTANPVDVENGQTTASGTNHDTPNVTTTVANAMLVTSHTYASAGTWTPQAGLTEGFDRPSGANAATGQSISGNFQLQAAAAATGAKRDTAVGNADVGNTHILALRPNFAPAVSLTSPASNTVFATTATITLAATATDAGGAIQTVEFFRGGTNLIGTATTSPYTFAWSGMAQGAYTLTAVATDNSNATKTSAPINITVSAAPTVSFTSPASGATFAAPANIPLTTAAADPDGSIAKVEFFNGAVLVGTATSAPFSFNWNGVSVGSYSLTAKATDNVGIETTSSAIAINVVANAAPTVSLTLPVSTATFGAPADITIAAQASDTDGGIAKVDFYSGPNLIATRTALPYSVVWTGVPQGNYSITARATDNLGGTTTSTPSQVVVGALLGTIYYVNLDHLDTPRLIEDQNQATVWTWHQAESFGSTPPNEDPDGDGLKFSLPLRFPGQYFDKETGLHYNYFRDFDPNLGRYIQSDPIGLEGGINTYGYALGTPLRYTDARGLETILVTTYDYGFGSHSAIYVNTPGQPPFLYDPAGSYQPNGEPRGTGGFFEGNQANLQDYVKYQESTGSTVEVVKIPTTPAQEQGIKERAMDIGDPRGFSCASAVSQALGGACGISESLFPGSLRRKAERAQCKVR